MNHKIITMALLLTPIVCRAAEFQGGHVGAMEQLTNPNKYPAFFKEQE